MRTFLALLLPILIFTTTGCATSKQIAKDTGACAEPKIVKMLPGLLPVVVAVLHTGNDGYASAALDALEIGIEGGAVVVACAVDAALTDLKQGAPVQAPAATASPPVMKRQIDEALADTASATRRGEAYLAGKGFARKGAPPATR